MTTYEFGDVVLLAFPHTDLTTISKRPAVVIYDSGDQDVLVARVTSQEQLTEADHRLADWRKCGLLAESYVRLGKQATVGKQLVARKLGRVETEDMEKLKTILKKILRLG
ncbi:MAG: type II toxin-antitoxin system PemK/MazF family toxin [Thermodesulfobacteriota bacterium]